MTSNPAPKSDRTWLYVALAFVAFWGLYLRFFGPRQIGAEPRLEPGNGAAEYAWRLTDLDGKPVAFSQFKGKAVFLNIWATWCGPCVGELPSIVALAKRPNLKDVAFVCVSTDDSPDTAKKFVEGKNWPMTVLHATDLPPVFTTEGIPATFIIGPDGRIASAEVGSADWDDPKAAALLEKLAKSAN